jgi:DNA-binding PadR family transcriptional regulator
VALSRAILAALLGGPASGYGSGYGLAKRFDRSVGCFWSATCQQIYRELAALETAGHVESEVVPQTDRRAMKRYTLTPGGRHHLAAWIAAPTQPGPLREDLLVKVRAGALVDPATLAEQPRAARAYYADRLARYEALKARDFPDPAALIREQRMQYLPLLRGLMFEAENVAWCDAALALLAADDLS